MSGTGKSAVVRTLVARGYKVIDTDEGWCQLLPHGRQIWLEDAIEAEDRAIWFSSSPAARRTIRRVADHEVRATTPLDEVVTTILRLAGQTRRITPGLGHPYYAARRSSGPPGHRTRLALVEGRPAHSARRGLGDRRFAEYTSTARRGRPSFPEATTSAPTQRSSSGVTRTWFAWSIVKRLSFDVGLDRDRDPRRASFAVASASSSSASTPRSADRRVIASRTQPGSSRCMAAVAPSTTALTLLAGSSPRTAILGTLDG
jgi:hypothetical protein